MNVDEGRQDKGQGHFRKDTAFLEERTRMERKPESGHRPALSMGTR